jgi:predicted metal-binding protein
MFAAHLNVRGAFVGKLESRVVEGGVCKQVSECARSFTACVLPEKQRSAVQAVCIPSGVGFKGRMRAFWANRTPMSIK